MKESQSQGRSKLSKQWQKRLHSRRGVRTLQGKHWARLYLTGHRLAGLTLTALVQQPNGKMASQADNNNWFGFSDSPNHGAWQQNAERTWHGVAFTDYANTLKAHSTNCASKGRFLTLGDSTAALWLGKENSNLSPGIVPCIAKL